MNWSLVFGAGLLAGATTCAATQGALLVGLLNRQQRDKRKGADSVVPVASFLVGKLITHTALGFVLGALGAQVALNAKIGAMALWLAGLVMVILGLGTLGVPGFKEISFAPPASWGRLVRKSTRSQSALAPFLLGLSTILIPCGVTISMEVLAASSGSAVTGALVMAVFVLGTAPLFSVFGYAAQRFSSPALGKALGAVVIIMGLVTINGALVASGSPISAQRLMGRGAAPVAAATAPAPAVTGGEQVLRMDAQNDGFVPGQISAKAGVPTKLILHTQDTRSCILSVVVPALGIQQWLPTTGDTELDLGVLSPGDLAISCSMGMYTADIKVS